MFHCLLETVAFSNILHCDASCVLMFVGEEGGRGRTIGFQRDRRGRNREPRKGKHECCCFDEQCRTCFDANWKCYEILDFPLMEAHLHQGMPLGLHADRRGDNVLGFGDDREAIMSSASGTRSTAACFPTRERQMPNPRGTPPIGVG